MALRKLLFIYKDGKEVNVVTYQKNPGGWQAVNFDVNRYIPFSMADTLSKQKRRLEEEGCKYKWESFPDDAA